MIQDFILFFCEWGIDSLDMQSRCVHKMKGCRTWPEGEFGYGPVSEIFSSNQVVLRRRQSIGKTPIFHHWDSSSSQDKGNLFEQYLDVSQPCW